MTDTDNGGSSVDQAATDQAAAAAGDQQQTAAKTFSQADLDRIVQERLARQRAQFPNEEELKTLRERAGKLDEIEQQNKTELEKAQERTVLLEKQANDAREQAREAILRSAVVAEAARKNVVDPDAALALLDRNALEFGDDGAPTNVADAMDSLLKAKPYLVGGGRAGGDLGARNGADATEQLTSADLKNMTPDQIVAARKAGQLTGLMRGD